MEERYVTESTCYNHMCFLVKLWSSYINYWWSISIV